MNDATQVNTGIFKITQLGWKLCLDSERPGARVGLHHAPEGILMNVDMCPYKFTGTTLREALQHALDWAERK